MTSVPPPPPAGLFAAGSAQRPRSLFQRAQSGGSTGANSSAGVLRPSALSVYRQYVTQPATSAPPPPPPPATAAPTTHAFAPETTLSTARASSRDDTAPHASGGLITAVTSAPPPPPPLPRYAPTTTVHAAMLQNEDRRVASGGGNSVDEMGSEVSRMPGVGFQPVHTTAATHPTPSFPTAADPHVANAAPSLSSARLVAADTTRELTSGMPAALHGAASLAQPPTSQMVQGHALSSSVAGVTMMTAPSLNQCQTHARDNTATLRGKDNTTVSAGVMGRGGSEDNEGSALARRGSMAGGVLREQGQPQTQPAVLGLRPAATLVPAAPRPARGRETHLRHEGLLEAAIRRRSGERGGGGARLLSSLAPPPRSPRAGRDSLRQLSPFSVDTARDADTSRVAEQVQPPPHTGPGTDHPRDVVAQQMGRPKRQLDESATTPHRLTEQDMRCRESLAEVQVPPRVATVALTGAGTHAPPHATSFVPPTCCTGEAALTAPPLQPPASGVPPLTLTHTSATTLPPPPPPTAPPAVLQHTSDYDTPRQPGQRLGLAGTFTEDKKDAVGDDDDEEENVTHAAAAAPFTGGQDERDGMRDHAGLPEPSPATLMKPGRYAVSPFLRDEEASRGEASPQPFPPPDTGLDGTTAAVEGGGDEDENDTGLVLPATLVTPAADDAARATLMRPALRGPPPPHTSATQSHVSPSPQVAVRPEASLRYELAEDVFDTPNADHTVVHTTTTTTTTTLSRAMTRAHNAATAPAMTQQTGDLWPPMSPAAPSTVTATSTSTFNPFVDVTDDTVSAAVPQEMTGAAAHDTLRHGHIALPPPQHMQPTPTRDARRRPLDDALQPPRPHTSMPDNHTYATTTAGLDNSTTTAAATAAATSGRDGMHEPIVPAGGASPTRRARMHASCFALFLPNSHGFVVCFNDAHGAPHTGRASQPRSTAPAAVSPLASAFTDTNATTPPRATPPRRAPHRSRLCFCRTTSVLTASGSIVDQSWVRGKEAGRRCANVLRALAQSPLMSTTDEAPGATSGATLTAAQAQGLLSLLTATPHPSIPHALSGVLSILIDDAVAGVGEGRTFTWNKEGVRGLVSFLLAPEAPEAEKSALPFSTLSTETLSPSPMATRAPGDDDTVADGTRAQQSMALQTIQTLVSQGAREQAVTVALRHCLYTHAILIAMMCSTKDLYIRVVKAVVEHELTPYSPLAHAYCLFNEIPCPSFLPMVPDTSERSTTTTTSPAVMFAAAAAATTISTDVTTQKSNDSNTTNPAKQSATGYLRTSWAQHAATLISNFTRQSAQGLVQLADDLVQHGLVLQGHTCLLLAHMTPLGTPTASATRRHVSASHQVQQHSPVTASTTTPRTMNTAGSMTARTPESSQLMAQLKQRLGVLGGFYHPRNSCRANFLSPTTTLLTDLLQQVRLGLDARHRLDNALATAVEDSANQRHHGLPVRTARYAIAFHFMQAMWLKEAGMLSEADKALNALATVVSAPVSPADTETACHPPQTLNALIYHFGALQPTRAMAPATMMQGEQKTSLMASQRTPAQMLPQPVHTQTSSAREDNRQADMLLPPDATVKATTPLSTLSRESAKQSRPTVTATPSGSTDAGTPPPPDSTRPPTQNTFPPKPQSATQVLAAEDTEKKDQEDTPQTDTSFDTKQGKSNKTQLKERPRRSRSIEAIVRFFRRGSHSKEGPDVDNVTTQDEVKPMILDTAKPPAYDKVTGRWLFEQSEEEKAQAELIRRGPPRLPPGRQLTAPISNVAQITHTVSQTSEQTTKGNLSTLQHATKQGPFSSAVRRGPHGAVRAQYVDMFNTK